MPDEGELSRSMPSNVRRRRIGRGGLTVAVDDGLKKRPALRAGWISVPALAEGETTRSARAAFMCRVVSDGIDLLGIEAAQVDTRELTTGTARSKLHRNRYGSGDHDECRHGSPRPSCQPARALSVPDGQLRSTAVLLRSHAPSPIVASLHHSRGGGDSPIPSRIRHSAFGTPLPDFFGSSLAYPRLIACCLRRHPA
jgi:hypothetical protein